MSWLSLALVGPAPRQWGTHATTVHFGDERPYQPPEPPCHHDTDPDND
ncbi:hypothetical protein AB0L82_31025 [Nocardia sp. NPDC052001]